MSVKAYVDMRSQPCRALLLFLKQSDIPHEVVMVDLFKEEQKKPEFTDVFPLGSVPTIKDGDFALGETIAIFRYLMTKYSDKVADHWYPQDVEKRARVDEYMAWQHTGTRKACCDVFVSEILLKMFKQPPTSEEQMKKELEALEKALDKLENAFMKDNKFLIGDEITVADLLAVSELIENMVFGRDHTEGRPKLRAYIDRVKEKLNPAFDEMLAPLSEMAKSVNDK